MAIAMLLYISSISIGIYIVVNLRDFGVLSLSVYLLFFLTISLFAVMTADKLNSKSKNRFYF